ncbi:MAG: hypothetical protein ACREYF_06980, partial [Gammaproteobacteria bacterium]
MAILYERTPRGTALALPRCRFPRSFMCWVVLGRLLAPKAICPLLLALGLGVTVQGAVPDALRPVVIGAVQRDAGPSYWVQGAQARNAAQG